MAQSAFRDSIGLRETHKESWINLCLCLHRSGQTGEAEAALDRAIGLFPSEDHFPYAKANLLGEQGRYGDAEGLYLLAIQMRPDKPNYHGNLGTHMPTLCCPIKSSV